MSNKNDENSTLMFLNNITLNYKNLQFNEQIIVYTYETYTDSNLLTTAQKLADKARMVKIIEPILTSLHREKIRNRNFLLQAPATTSSTPHL
jgi:hypothetical protein